MENILSDREWQYLSQVIYRINQCFEYEEFGLTAMRQLQTMIPFRKARMARTDRHEGRIIQSSPVCINPPGITFDESIYILGGYRSPWYEYLFCPWSTAFRYSDIRKDEIWEQSKLYLDIWKPQQIYYGLHCTLIHNDQPLGIFSFYRSKEEQDFTDKELFIMDVMKIHLELQLYRILLSSEGNETPQTEQEILPLRMQNFSKIAADYQLTKQETNIAKLMFEGKSSSEICDSLFISSATLRKHIYNIYRKTHVKSRVQLMQLFM